jgi:hypothetical protein
MMPAETPPIVDSSARYKPIMLITPRPVLSSTSQQPHGLLAIADVWLFDVAGVAGGPATLLGSAGQVGRPTVCAAL